MLQDLLVTVALFLLTILGLGWPLASHLELSPVEKLLATTGLSFLGTYLLAWFVYIAGLPAEALWAIPILAAVGLLSGVAGIRVLVRDPLTRIVFVLYLLVTLWCVGWLGLVSTYTGGGWSGDWFEHWERSRFFLERWPRERMFLVIYPLPARPPLVNVVTGAFLHLTHVNFAHYQLISTLLAALVFLPAAVLAGIFRRGADTAPATPDLRLPAIVALFFLVNPLFVQNATFAWTKLPAAFLVLAALYFFLRHVTTDAPACAGRLCAVLLAGGFLAHYSAGPYIAMLVVGWLAFGWPHRGEAAWWRGTLVAAAFGAAFLATWFGWSLATYGTGGTLLSNTSVTAVDSHAGGQFVRVLLNLRDTFVPHFLRPLDQSLVAQRSPWGWWHDWLFQAYQLNLPLAFGSVAWLAIIRELGRGRGEAAPASRRFWAAFISGVIFLGIATHGARDTWGLTHICLQPLVLLGLAFLAARWSELGRGWRLALIAGATVDLLTGVVFHFAIQNFALDRLFTPGRDVRDVVTSYNAVASGNTFALAANGLDTFSVWLNAPAAVIGAVVTAIFVLVLLRTRTRSAVE
jgi:hypothetical protein